MKRSAALILLILSLCVVWGCSLRFFTIRFANTGTSDIDIIGVYMAPAGGAYGENLLPVGALHTGEYFILEKLDRWKNYDVKVVFDVMDPDTQAYFERELKDNVPVAPPDNCVSWTANYDTGDYGPSWQISYSWGCDDDEYDYILVGEQSP